MPAVPVAILAPLIALLTVLGMPSGNAASAQVTAPETAWQVVSAAAVSATPVVADVAHKKGCKGQVALTFDDGPTRGTTRRLVKILKNEDVPATFFMVGSRVRAFPKAARQVERAGFLVANHSWAHLEMNRQTYPQVRRSLRATRKEMKAAGLHPTTLMRPPYGALSRSARRAIRDTGFVPVLWTNDSLDWKWGNSRQIARRILANLHKGKNIVLQHDGVNRSPISVGAVRKVIRTAKRRGFCFTALNEKGKPGYPTPMVSGVALDGPEGGAATVTLRLRQPAGRATAIALTASSASAAVGSDLPAFRKRIVIPSGSTEVAVSIPVSADAVLEPTEHFVIGFSDPEGVQVAPQLATNGLPVGITDASAAVRNDLPGPPFLKFSQL